MKKIKNFLIDRIFEKTTWAGLALLGLSMDIHNSPEDIKIVIEAFLAGFGISLVVKKEK